MKTNPKIGLLMVTGVFYPEISGEAIQMQNICQWLPSEIVNIYVLTTTFNPSLEKVSFINGVSIYRICLKSKGLIWTIFLLLKMTYLFLKIQKNIDIVQFSGFSNKMILLSFLCKLLRKKVIQRLTLIREDDPLSIRSQQFGVIKYFFYSKADFYITISPALTKAALQSFKKDRIIEIPIGVDTDKFKPPKDLNDKISLKKELSLPLDKKIIIFVGLICERKGVDILVEAWKRIRQTEKLKASVILVGSTDKKHYMIKEDFIKNVKQDILASGMESEVLFIRENDKIDKYLKASDIFVFPTRREGLPNALIEAMSTGLPCVASRIEGVTDRLIRDKTDGFLIEREDAESYAVKLKELLNNETMVIKMGLSARQRAIEEFSIDKVTAEHLKLYQLILSPDKDTIKQTHRAYSFLWNKSKTLPLSSYHYNRMQNVITENIVRGAIGIDVGSGCGYDTYIMAKNNPQVKIISIDISDGIDKTKELTSTLKNVQIIRGSILDTPIKDSIFDFAYSFGVLHHTIDPKKGLLEIVRILKKDAPAFLYLYEDHSENPIKYTMVRIITRLRVITVRINSKILYALSWLISPFIFIIFSCPAKILKKFKPTQHFAKKVPFSFGTNLFSLRGDLYDRFSAPIEHRFNRQEIYDLFTECGFGHICITRLNDSAGWVVWGYKK